MIKRQNNTTIVQSILIKLPLFLLAAFCYVVIVITYQVNFNFEYIFLIPTSVMTLILGSTILGCLMADIQVVKSIANMVTLPTLNAIVFGVLFVFFVLFGSILDIGSQGIFLSYLLLTGGIGVTLFVIALQNKALTDQSVVISVLAVIIGTVSSIIGLHEIVSLVIQIAAVLNLFVHYLRTYTK